tara:strand:+ start:78 stop:239 length:162 start_codon:yes stop_codon:yes gene_type:complete
MPNFQIEYSAYLKKRVAPALEFRSFVLSAQVQGTAADLSLRFGTIRDHLEYKA